MAWRPTQYLIDGELDNTTPGKVTGWMRLAGLSSKVTFDLTGDFHRDIRGAKVRFRGDGSGDDNAGGNNIVSGGKNGEEARKYLDGFSLHQSGQVGDMTAGLPPRDYVDYPYLEWYGDHNGRVVIELAPGQLTLIGKPIPWCESDPISLQKQQQNMASFLASLCKAMRAPAIVVGVSESMVSDPKFSHWVIVDGQIVGEAHSVQKVDDQQSYAFVRLHGMPENAEYGPIQSNHLLTKSPGTPPPGSPRNPGNCHVNNPPR